MKATTLLERQHRNLQQLCEAVERGSASIRESLLPQLAGDLVAHIAVEEQVFYPAACAALHEEGWWRSGMSWHARARQSLDRALDAPLDGDEFEQAMGDLREAVELHAEEAEEMLFPQLERALDQGAMRQLGVSMMSLYHAKLEAGFAMDQRPSPMPLRAQPPSAAR
jgi:iron-sulfur cluster repair protein YtfE (RIC family)